MEKSLSLLKTNATIVRKAICDTGFNSPEAGFDGNTCAVLSAIDEQSGDIAMGVDKALEARENAMTDEQLEAAGVGADLIRLSCGLENLQDEQLKHHESYPDSRTAFHAAVQALKDIINT